MPEASLMFFTSEEVAVIFCRSNLSVPSLFQ
jgi:hypothetical protein